jgi:hypothetical protein
MNKATMLKKGDRVRISKGSRYYGKSDPYNPIDVTGTIYDINESHDEFDYCYEVEWDNGKKNGYQAVGDLYLYRGDNKFERKKQDKLIVSKEFLLAAYNAACADWKQRLEREFPEVFETDKYPTLVDINKGEEIETAVLYVRVRDTKTGEGRYTRLNGVQLADGIAIGAGDNCGVLPRVARYKALYIESFLGREYSVRVKNAGLPAGSHVVYFEKK